MECFYCRDLQLTHTTDSVLRSDLSFTQHELLCSSCSGLIIKVHLYPRFIVAHALPMSKIFDDDFFCIVQNELKEEKPYLDRLPIW